MTAMPSLHKQYTLHDETHLWRVTELMAKVIPIKVLNELNPIELALLILSAYYHDQGMILDDADLQQLRSTSDFQIFMDSWGIEHPNLKEIRNRLSDRTLSSSEKARCRQAEQELLEAMLTEYIRKNHAQRSAELVERKAGDPLWKISGSSLSFLVAKLCESHSLPATYLTPANGFNYELIPKPSIT